MCMLIFIPTYGILLLIGNFAVITKYTVLDEQRREAKEGKSQRKNPRSITRAATLMPVFVRLSNKSAKCKLLFSLSGSMELPHFHT